MSKSSIQLCQYAIFCHRWLGVGFCVLFVVWFLSGMVMMYWGYPGVDVVVVGGGDSALDEGIYLSGIVSSVTFVHRRDELRATKVLQERAFANEKIKFLWSHVVENFVGNEFLEAAKVKNLKTEEVYDYPTAAAFIYVGFHPNSEYLKGVLDMDLLGHLYTDMHMRTKVHGVYACGDIRTESTRQLGVAVGDGITAALSAYHDLL